MSQTTVNSDSLIIGVKGSVNGGNIITLSTPAVAAGGTVQGDATQLQKNAINTISSVSAGGGVKLWGGDLPYDNGSASVIVNKDTVNSAKVYPASGDTINSLATNAPYILAPSSSLTLQSKVSGGVTVWTSSSINSNSAGAGTNNASGVNSGIVAGINNTSSGLNSVVGGGHDNTSSGINSYIAAGNNNISSGLNSGVGSGVNNNVSGPNSHINSGSANISTGSLSSIAGGQNNNDGGFNNVHILGSNITADAADTSYVENLAITTTPATDGGSLDALVYDPVTKKIKKRSIGSGSVVTQGSLILNPLLVVDTSTAISSSDTTLYRVMLDATNTIVPDNITSVTLNSLTTNTKDISIQSQLLLTSISISSLTTIGESILINQNPLLTSINLNSLSSVPGGSLQFSQNASLTSISLPALATTNALSIINNNALTSLSVTALTSINSLGFSGNHITSLTFSSLTTLNNASISGPFLTTVNLSSVTTGSAEYDINGITITSIVLHAATALPSSCLQFDFTSCALPVAGTGGVNDILVKLDGWGRSNGSIDISGQTPSAPPSGAGATAVTNLIGKGWSVTTD